MVTQDTSPRLDSRPTPPSSVGSDDVVPLTVDPSVIVGMAFRFPGATNMSQLWDNLSTKKDLLRKMPKDRFNVEAFYHPLGANKGTTNARYGYFLDQPLAEFDNEFFRISGKEAEGMDPQQRLLLEVVYEALENAGIPLEDIKGSCTSVYVGSFSNDYNSMVTKDLAMYPKYTVTGIGNAMLSNRISYFFDLNGPSMTVDTACSSSLVCFHFGSQSLQSGEADIAIVAGSALHFDPSVFITMTDFGMLSSDGRCRTFDQDGSGYVRGEGVCAMILKRQSSAIASGNRIRAVIRGTGSNHDGAKPGLTLPNGRAQENLILQTYRSAGLDTSDTDYVEAHGTGTRVGDPIEANAIGTAFSSAKERDRPLFVGSIKSNIGHLEGASGLAGIVKAVMSVDSGKILPNMHFSKPNPDIDFQGLKIRVPTEVVDWPTSTGVRRASVNSFGYGGSNAHVILENYNHQPHLLGLGDALYGPASPEPTAERPYLLPLTAHNDQSLKNLSIEISSYISRTPNLNMPDIALSYSTRRSKLQKRTFVIGSNPESLVSSLENLVGSKAPVGPLPRLGFVFTGQGAQWYGMGRELLEKSTIFRQTIERCDEILSNLPDGPQWACVEELQKSAPDTRLGESLISQPVCAALQLALVTLLKAWGIVPAAVVGHSSGEIVAAYAAGILSFENTIICAYYRGLYMSHGKDSCLRGAMMAVGMSEDDCLVILERFKGRIALAAVNSQNSLTLSGDEDSIMEIKEDLDRQGVFNRRLRVEQAFHSHHMYPLAPGFRDALLRVNEFRPATAQVKMVSSVTARDSSAVAMDAHYWAANMTGVVRFADALGEILLDENEEQNVDILVEIGPHPALKGPSLSVVKSLNLDVPYVATLHRDAPAYESLLATAGEIFGLGYHVDLPAVNSEHHIDIDTGEVIGVTTGRILTDLPSYPWDHRNQFWAGTRAIRDYRSRKTRHSLLGAIVPGSSKAYPLWRSYLHLGELPWLGDHVVDGKVVFPGAGYLSMAIEAICNSASSGAVMSDIEFRDVLFKNALVLNNDETGTEILLDMQPLATSAKSVSSTWFRFSIASFGGGDVMTEHCYGQIRLNPGSCQARPEQTDFARSQKILNRRKSSDLLYSQLYKVGLNYGETFRLLSGYVESGSGLAYADLKYDPSKVLRTAADECILHPSLLDSAFHVIFPAIESCTGERLRETFVPTFIRHMKVSGLLYDAKTSTDLASFRVQCATKMPGKRVAHNQLRMFSGCVTDSESLLVDIDGLEVTALGNDTATVEEERQLFFRLRWLPLFSCLGTFTSRPVTSYSLGNLLDIFAHEVPNAKILHLTSDPALVEDALSLLGGSGGTKRRFDSLTAWSQSDTDSLVRVQDGLEAAWPGLVKVSIPKPDEYDLVILGEEPIENVRDFLAPGGFLITGDAPLEGLELAEVFHIEKFRCLQSAIDTTNTDGGAKLLTIILSDKSSEETERIAAEITRLYAGRVQTVTLSAAQPTTHHAISLVSLDEDLFFETHLQEDEAAISSLQSLIQSGTENLVWFTQDATGDAQRPEQAIVTGLMRTIRNEQDGIRIATLDITRECRGDSMYVAKRALQTLLRCNKEDEFSDRNGALCVPRVEADEARNRKLPVAANRQVQKAPLGGGRNLALTIGKIGLLDTLAFDDDKDMSSAELGVDEVEVLVRASALNFRDVAAAIGIIDDYRLGDEAAGIVTRTGCGVDPVEFKAGDRVLTIRPGQGAHRSMVRSPTILCQKIESMDFVTAASFSAVLITAYYSLLTVARLRKGEFCLVHAAAGGVGQMAIQIAQMLGAKVIATVGAPEKREALKQRFNIPDEMIFSSRDDSFIKGVLAVTDGRGCDVVLNSLAGELLHATWQCIAPLGRFVEIGKRDIHENAKLDMDPFRRNVSYSSVDLITLYHVDRPFLSSLMHDCYRLIRDGKILPPQPIKTFSYGEAQMAFRTLQMGKFFGKIVLVPDDDELIPVIPASFISGPLFKADKSYLLVGGLGGIGRQLSEWMFRRGARKIAFLSRSGIKKQEAKDTITWLRARGAQADVFAGDVADRTWVESCINSLNVSLAGIFQAAMVLKDAPFSRATASDWQACVRPKTLGTWNLHNASKELDLDFFVCFSSASSVVGSLGQANYAAANSYLDALMSYRRSLGLPGTTMNVGVVSDAGAVAEDESLSNILDRLGYDTITMDELFYHIEEAVISSKATGPESRGVDVHQIITGINTRRKDVYWANKALFRNLYGNLDLLSDQKGRKGTVSLISSLKATESLKEKTALLLDAYLVKIAAVMGTTVETIQISQPLSAYGLDSIVAVEFRKWFSTAAGVDVPLFDILSAKSIKGLIEKVSQSLRYESKREEPSIKARGEESAVSQQSSERSRPQQTGIMPSIAGARTPLSNYQTRLWFLHNILPDKSALNVVVSCGLHGKPNLAILQNALGELAKRNGILRTKYFEGDEFTEQALVESIQTRINYRDISDSSDVGSALKQAIEVIRREPINIEKGEAIVSCAYKLSEQEYRLAFVFHHIVLDNGSTRSFIEQFVGLYAALAGGRNLSTVSAPRISYRDFTVWHNEFLKTPKILEDVSWWQETLRGAPDRSSLLPFAKSKRSATTSIERHTVEAIFNKNQLKRLKRLASLSRATAFHFILAAFRCFIYRYNGEEDLTILMIDGTRPHPDVSDVLGFFVNMVPLRMKLDIDSSFDRVLSQTAGIAVEALAHNTVPFDTILNALDVNRTEPGHPLGQIAINYQMYGKPEMPSTPDFMLSEFSVQDIPTACDIALEVTDNSEVGLELKLQYDPRLYNSCDIDRLLENFTVFLSSAVKDHRQPIDEIYMCGPGELKHLQSDLWGIEMTPDPWGGMSVVSKVLSVAESRPDSIAIETSDGQIMTYGELAKCAKQVAMELRRAPPASENNLVGIMLQPTTDTVVAMFGAALAGYGYVPLDFGFPSGRLKEIVAEASISTIIVSEDLRDQVSSVSDKATKLVLPLANPNSTGNFIRREPLPSDPFYVVFTSGSTGTPKGIIVTHENTQAMLSALSTLHGFTNKDKVLFQSSAAFDLSVVQIWGSLTAGATVLLAKEDVRRDPQALVSFMRRGDVTITYTPPTQFGSLIMVARNELAQCSKYRAAMFAGELLSPVLARQIFDLGLANLTVYNQYGPSETTVQTTCHKLSPSCRNEVIPIGIGLANCCHYIVDSKLQPVPASVVGEVCLGGPQVTAGYINRPELNARHFVEDKFASDKFRSRGWTTMYLSGDRARFLADGQLDFRGRIAGDSQIKLRGFRIELGEINHALTAIIQKLLDSSTVEVVTMARTPNRQQVPDDQLVDDRQLIAFIINGNSISESGRQGLANAIHKAASEELNSYMLPDGYQFTANLPALTSGKRNARELLGIDLDLVYPSTILAGLENRSELKEEDVLSSVIAVFKKVLRLSDKRLVESTDSFFNLGGHSVLALRLLAHIKQEFDIKIDARTFITDPTPLSVAKILSEKNSSVSVKPGVINSTVHVDWQVEAMLPEEPQFYPSTPNPEGDGGDKEKVLLTGADTIVGVHMLVELLNRDPACSVLVLGVEKPLARSDIVSLIRQYGLILDNAAGSENRVVVLPGSLNQDNLGLLPSHFDSVGQSVSAIYHFGSRVSLLKSYGDLKRVNVDATRDIIRMAALREKGSTSIHYLSTWSVVHLQGWKTTKRSADGPLIKDERVPDHFVPTGDELAYFKTRWTAEMLLSAAGQRGIASAIYRISGLDIKIEEDNLFLNIVNSIIKTGLIPNIKGEADGSSGFAIDTVPPAYVASSVARLAATKMSDGGVFHIRNPRPLGLAELTKILSPEHIQSVPTGTWVEAVLARDELEGAVTAGYVDVGHRMFSLDDGMTREILHRSLEADGVRVEDVCPPVDEKFVNRLTSNSVRTVAGMGGF